MNPLVKTAIETVKTVASKRYYSKIEDLRNLSTDSFWQFQSETFERIYRDAVNNVPYYQSRPDIYPKSLDFNGDVLETLSYFPVLPKAVVKKDTPQFWRNPKLLLTTEHTTGGTTGSPLRVKASLWERGFTEAIIRDRYEDLIGNQSPRILRLSGYLDESISSELIVRIPGTKYAYLSIYQLVLTRTEEIRSVIEEFRPEVLHGYASALHQLSLLFANQPLDLGHKLCVVSTSETLMDHQREDIKQFLNADVFNEYGSQEGQHLALECPKGSLHIHPARGVIEILGLDNDTPAAEGELGRVVVTGLMLRTMPLIRYDIGDSAISTGYATGCACGLQWPTIGIVYGRTEDLVHTRDGGRIGLLSHSTLKDWPGIHESQIEQQSLEEFVYRIVPQDPGTFDHEGLEKHVKAQLGQRLGYDAHIRFEYVNSVPRSRVGKIQAVVVADSLKIQR